MITKDELYLFERELKRLEEVKENIRLDEKYRLFIEEQIELFETIIYAYDEQDG